MLSRLVVKNFKSIGEPGVDLELKPLTILVGPNGSGKSSIFEAVAFGAQDFRRGEMYEFEPEESAFCHRTDVTLTIELYFNQNPSLKHKYLFGPTTQGSRQWITDGKQVSDDPVLREGERIWAEDVKDKTFLLGSARGAVKKDYSTSYEPRWVGRDGEYLVPLLANIFGGLPKNKRIVQKINKWMVRFGARDVSAGIQGRDKMRAGFEDPCLEVALEFAASSGGARQIACVVTQLFWAPKRSIIIIEEPEISLHPESQLHLIDLFAEVIKEEKQILITTHSPILVTALSHGIQQSKLGAQDVAIYHVVKKKETGTIDKRLTVNEKGHVEGWIPSFAKVERKLLREWVRSLPKV